MKPAIALALAALIASPSAAQQANREAFSTGLVFEEFGPHAPVETAEPIPSFSRFEIAFDVATAAEEGTRNRGFESAARFMNMHVAAGVPEDRIKLVVVVHGTAAGDLVTGNGNGSEAMIRAMMERGVRFIICGQSMAARGVNPDELIEGVETQLSAMTAHALLQQQGYTVNPF